MLHEIKAMKKYSNKSIIITFVDNTFGIYKNNLVLDYFLNVDKENPNYNKIMEFFEDSYVNKEISESLYKKYNNVNMAKKLI
jgi:hypothetical protein